MPAAVGGPADRIAGHQATEAPDRLTEHDAGGGRVKQSPHRKPFAPRKARSRQPATENRAHDRQPARVNRQNLQWVRHKERPAVKHIQQPRTNQAAHGDPEHKIEHRLSRQPTALRLAEEQPDSDEHACGYVQAVP